MNPIEMFKGVIGAAKLAVNAASEVKNADLNFQLAELTQKLAELHVEFTSLLLENSDLKQKLKEEQDANQNPPELDGDVYFFAEEFGPCCTRCWDSERKKLLLKERSSLHQANYQGDAVLYCPSCKTDHCGSGDEE